MFSPMAGSCSDASVSFLGLFHSLGMEVFLKGMLELKGRTHQGNAAEDEHSSGVFGHISVRHLFELSSARGENFKTNALTLDLGEPAT